MPSRFSLAVAVLLSFVLGTPALAQRRVDAQTAFSLPTAALKIVSAQEVACPVRLKPFVLSGLGVGFAVGTWKYVDAVNDTDDGDFFWPLSAIVVVGGGMIVGGLVGYIAGTVAPAVRGCAPA